MVGLTQERLTYSAQLCYDFPISSNNNRMRIANFPIRISDGDSHSPDFSDSFLSCEYIICCVVSFPPSGNSDHVVVSVSIDVRLNSNGSAPFYRKTFDYSRTDWSGLPDHIIDVPLRACLYIK